MPSREAARAREVYRYYQPKSQALPDPIDTFSNSPSTTNASCPTSEAHLESVSLEGFSDTALTAFAQLIAIRLNCQRAVISLIDHETEYLLAESPATFSASHDANQDTWASKRRNNIPRHASLCEEVINLVSKSNLSSGARPTCSVLDLQLHEKLQALECVKQAPNLRFFCGVPLTNNNGITIGCVYVVDDQPRQQNVSGEQSLFLQEMTVTVMDHLENNRAKEDVAMVTQMSQALHAFIEGDGTMKGDWERLKKYNLPGAGAGYHWESNNHDTNATHGVKSSSPTVEISMPDGYDGGLSPGQSPLQHPTSTHDVRAGFNNSPWASTSEVPQLNTAKDRLFANNGFSNLLHTTFARASNLVREGMMVDGAVFFDAPFRFYQARSTLEADLRRIDSSQDTDSSSDEGNEDGDAYTSPQVRPRPHPHMTAHESHRSDETDHSLPSGLLDATSVAGVKADILGFSTHKSSSWDNSEVNPTDNFKAIEQSLLTALVRRYPKGSLFTFDEDGPRILPEVSDVVESQAAPTASLKGRKHSRHIVRVRAELELLLEAFPAARSILFIPLYDATSGCFIGSFAWSTSPTQCFSVENHLSYLVAFGHSVMSTVSQLNTLSADHAKGDFISNVSHELRSPLHGVLASVEFLADTALDGFQRNLVETVDICGRTLLDTIEHVLDFSKIKKFGKETAQPMGAVSNLDISAVIEEVIQGVYAGFEFNGLSSQGLADRTSSHNRSSTPVGGQRTTPESNRLPPRQSRENPAIILDMDFREQWVFPTVSGTWRRLTMNLFGNALKYTSTGFIKIKLEARNLSPSKQLDPVHAIQKTMVTLTISDSGQGMSTDFMKTKLFMPFSQEDVTAPGTGLGMSIVKQIVDLSDGRIDVRSEAGKGTEMKLRLPLDNIIPGTNLASGVEGDPGNETESPIIAVRRRSEGRKVTILGFEPKPSRTKLQQAAMASQKASIERYMTEWFNLDIASSNLGIDIIVCDESATLDLRVTDLSFRVLIIICASGARRDVYTSQLSKGQTLEFVSKPSGPHRLAKALLNCFDTEDANKMDLQTRTSEDVLLKSGSLTRNLSDSTASISRGARLIGNLPSKIVGFPPTFSENKTQPGEASPLITESLPVTPISTSSSMQMVAVTIEGHIFAASTRIPKMLLVEDNPINMMLLETYMKKNKWELETASNGLLAMEAFQRRIEGFDVIFMDVSMPVMTGYESTRNIRRIEAERRLAYEHQQNVQSPWLYDTSSSSLTSFPFMQRPANYPIQSSLQSIDLHISTPEIKLNPPALIIALTGFSSKKDQQMAFEAGVDVFMTKPVRFREVGKILEGWAKSRKEEEEKRVDSSAAS